MSSHWKSKAKILEWTWVRVGLACMTKTTTVIAYKEWFVALSYE